MTASPLPRPDPAPDADAAAFDPKLMGVLQQSEALVGLMQEFFSRMDSRRSQDFLAIADSIAQAKADIRNLRPQEISQTRLPTAGAELLAITRDTENATNVIMNAAEAMLDLDPSMPDIKDRVDDEVMKIFEACSFQDITGQRVSKIIQVLSQIEQRVSHLAESLGIEDAGSETELTAEEKRKRDLLLNGPAIGGPETRQSQIDDLFAEPDPGPAAEEPASQDAIDALFD